MFVAVLIDEKRREYAQYLVRSAPEGWVMTIKEPTRTLEQNALLWPLLEDLSEQIMWPLNGALQKLSPNDWKDLATASLEKEQRVSLGFDGGLVLLGRRTSTMGKRKFSDLLEVIYAFGAAQGVTWKTAN